jgi:hypothetical protein
MSTTPTTTGDRDHIIKEPNRQRSVKGLDGVIILLTVLYIRSL